MEKILKIECIDRVREREKVRIEMSGYEVTTDQHIYTFLIGSEQICCESWGHMQSEDDLDYYIGKDLFDVSLTDSALNTFNLDGFNKKSSIQFVTFKTSHGAFQLAVYNDHNGYYGHPIVVLKDGDILLNSYL